MNAAHRYSVGEMANFQKTLRDKRRAWLEANHKRSDRCHYCRNRTVLLARGANSKIKQVPGTFHATLDHATPTARGGKDWPTNYRLCCNTCNGLKADMTETEYRKLLVEEGVL